MPRRTAVVALAIAATLVAVALAPPRPTAPAQAAGRATPTGPAPTPRGTEIARPCVVTGTRRVEPTTVQLGETIDVTMTVRAACSGAIFPLHVALVIEGSAAMADGLGRDVKAAASALLDALDLPNNPHTRVAVIGFDDRVRVKCPVSSDDWRVRRCIERIGAQGNARLDLGIAEARRQLVAASDDYNESGRDTQRQVTVVFAARPTGDCARSMHEASRLKGLGILLLTACVGEDCDVQCIRSMATSPRYHFSWRNRLRPAQYFRSYNPGFQNVILKRLAIDDHLPGTLQILTDTMQPPPTLVDVATGRLRWTQTHIPKEGVTFTFRTRSLAVGHQPSTLGATGAFTDNRNRTGSIVFPTTPITVVRTMSGIRP